MAMEAIFGKAVTEVSITAKTLRLIVLASIGSVYCRCYCYEDASAGAGAGFPGRDRSKLSGDCGSVRLATAATMA